MGLDGVELVMDLEETFGITIADAEAQECITPAAIIEMVLAKLQLGDERVCMSQRAFYQLRKGLTQAMGVSRRNVTLDTDVRSLAAARPERIVWEDLKKSVQARSWPALVRPPWLVAGLWFLFLVTFGVLFFLFGGTLAALGAVLVGSAAIRITEPLRSRIPPRCSPIRKLVPFAATSDAVVWTREGVVARVRELVISHLGLREEQYREDAHLVKDLGMS
jgi:acyl carrier protein